MNLVYLYQDVVSWNSFVGNKFDKKNLSELYVNLVKEETQEIFDSINNNDPIEFIDGICDTLVVGSFLLAVKNQKDFSDYKINFEKVNIKESILKIKELVEKDIYSNIEEIMKLVENISFSSKINVEEAFKEVMRSNWSKFPLIDSVIPLNEVRYIEKQGRYNQVRFEMNTDTNFNDRYIFKDGNGKVVKPSTFEEPQLEKFISNDYKIFS